MPGESLIRFGKRYAAALATLPLAPEPPSMGVDRPDWLLDPSTYRAGVFRTDHPDEIVLSNGLISRTFRLQPNGATVGFDNLVSGETVIRGVKPEAVVSIDGVRYEVGGLKGQPNYAYLKPEWVDDLAVETSAFALVDFEVGEPTARLEWKRVRHHAPGVVWPPAGVYLRMDYRHTDSPALISVHYELYDGLPAMSKWITVRNGSDQSMNIDTFTSETLAAVEAESWVEARGVPTARPNIHVETDYAFTAMEPLTANRFAVRWVPDPDYLTQVNYARTAPALLEVGPSIGPDQTLAPGDTFESFRTFVLIYDSTDRERRGLALRRLYRTVAPWVTENPLMMHVRFADWESVRNAIDQAAEVGFEMVILTFGSGFNIEDDSPAHLAEMKRYADYARSRSVEIGGYSLLASRRIEPDGDNAINAETGVPGGQTFGFAPALASDWGQRYFAKLYRFFDETGFTLLEHDGSYPGDLDAAARPPLQKGLKDSRWVQWRIISDFYKWCRSRGIYLNVPDWYYLSGSNKNGMGYRETNWSLPRAQQVIHTRQNIFDGTWGKTPSMGWMFVPLTEYQGGGAAATIEPLDEHLAHYERMLYSNLALGVQAAYRGPRLYDTERTKQMVLGWVNWFKTHRDILESDVIHGRRADGRDIDWMLHVNPDLEQVGMLVVFNPLDREVERTLKVPLYYTGLDTIATFRGEGSTPFTKQLARDYTVELTVTVPAEGMTWFVIE